MEDACNKRIEIARQCAPVLADIKLSNLLLLADSSDEEIREMVHRYEVEVQYLYRGIKKNAWFLYRREKMNELLSDKENREFLYRYGYRDFTCSEVLKRLGIRAQLYMDKKAAYPHELGLLLGYPLCDVKGFIEYEGKNYLISGYWKVYRDVESAKQTFALYHKSRQEAVQRVLNTNMI